MHILVASFAAVVVSVQEVQKLPRSLEIIRLPDYSMVYRLEGDGDATCWTASSPEDPTTTLYRIPLKLPLTVPDGARFSLVEVGDRLLSAMDACGGACGTWFYIGSRTADGFDFNPMRRPVATAWREGEEWLHGYSIKRPCLVLDGADPRLIGSHQTESGESVFVTERGALAAFLSLGLSDDEGSARIEAVSHHSPEDREIGGGETCLPVRVIMDGRNPRVCRIGSLVLMGLEELGESGSSVVVRLYSSSDLEEWRAISLPPQLDRPHSNWSLSESSGGVYFLSTSRDGVEFVCELWELSGASWSWRYMTTRRLPEGVVRVAYSARSGGPAFLVL